MKVRQGFVSNSSSSSFLVGFVKKPDSVEELRQLLYGDKEFLQGYNGWDHKTQKMKYKDYSTLDLAAAVYRDMDKPATPLQIVRMLADVDDYEIPEIPDSPEESDFIVEVPPGGNPYNNIDWVAYGRARADAARNMVKAALGEDHEKLVWYVFHYSDEGGGFNSLLEHGNTFVNLPGICNSHH